MNILKTISRLIPVMRKLIQNITLVVVASGCCYKFYLAWILEWKSKMQRVFGNIRKTMEASGLDGIVDCMSKWMSRKYFPHTDVSKVIETPIVKEENGKK